MRDKLDANADHFPTARQRLATIKGWCSGEAAGHLLHRSRPGASEPYQDAEDVIKHLKLIYDDVNKDQRAMSKFRKLQMKNSDKFQKFLSDFTYLAQEADVPKRSWKEELYQRLPPLLQGQAMAVIDDPETDFQAFSRYCTRRANRIEEQIANRKTFGPSKPLGEKSTGEKPAGRTDRQNTPTAAGQSEKKGFSCYTCKQPGHLARNCPMKNQEGDVKVYELPDSDDDATSKKNKDSGNASP